MYISGLRNLLGAASDRPRITYRVHGYVLSADERELDWLTFERVVREARLLWNRAGPSAAAQTLDEALTLWRGPVLDGMRGVMAIEETAVQLESRFLSVFEDWAEAQLELGVSPSVVEKISEVARRHPVRERLRMAQMTALSRIGRRTEALAVFDELRRTLASEFGLGPSAALQQLHRSLLHEEEPPYKHTAVHVLRRPAPGCTLPRDIGAFVGREEHTRKIEAASNGSGERLAIVTGPPGVGKTAIAVHAAHRSRDRFPDGCYLVRLRRTDDRPRPPEEIAAELMWAAGAPGVTEQQADMPAMWRHWLAGSRALVVLDGARSEREVRPFLPEAGESAVIVTALTRLAGLEWADRITLPVFSTAEAIGLLRRIVGDRRIDSDRQSAESIVKAVGLLPLAVRIVGDKLAGLDHVPLSEYLERVRNAPSLLDELAVGDVAVRAGLAAAIADLSPESGKAFRRLAMLPNGFFSLDEAIAALNVDEGTAVRILESLLETNIIGVPDAETVAHDVVYEMPVLTHAYARELSIDPIFRKAVGQ
jgi:DNA-binding SARP family transcriptional activator